MVKVGVWYRIVVGVGGWSLDIRGAQEGLSGVKQASVPDVKITLRWRANGYAMGPAESKRMYVPKASSQVAIET